MAFADDRRPRMRQYRRLGILRAVGAPLPATDAAATPAADPRRGRGMRRELPRAVRSVCRAVPAHPVPAGLPAPITPGNGCAVPGTHRLPRHWRGERRRRGPPPGHAHHHGPGPAPSDARTRRAHPGGDGERLLQLWMGTGPDWYRYSVVQRRGRDPGDDGCGTS